MRRMRILGLALVSLFAISMFAAAGASANPHWYECAQVTGAKFEKGCATEGGKGGFELKKGSAKASRSRARANAPPCTR